MIRNILMWLEIVSAAAAFVGGAAMVVHTVRAQAKKERGSPAKLQLVWDLLLMDVIWIAMAAAAWTVYTERSWARWMSMAAGAALICILSARPRLAGGRAWVASILALLGIGVVAFAVLLPSGG